MITPVCLKIIMPNRPQNNRCQNNPYLSVKLSNLECDCFETCFLGSQVSTANKKELFIKEAMTPVNSKWQNAVKRYSLLENKKDETRTEFERDRTRIMYSEGFDRMRYKTQVFPICDNDMVSTRSTHVLQVADIARNISRSLGLNEELAEAIAMGHDLGHPPFGHEGEAALAKITKNNNLPLFWHEKNSLRLIDKILTLTNSKGRQNNLGLTYAVRDGIINHCGELDENAIKPRTNYINLEVLTKAGDVQPYTWEGVVVKVSDKIAYLGRDIEDAFKIGILKKNNIKELNKIVKKYIPNFDGEVSNTALINIFVTDLIANSSPENGIGFSKPVFELMNAIKTYNYQNIYCAEASKALSPADCEMIISGIFKGYEKRYNGYDTIKSLEKENNKYVQNFKEWLVKYTDNPYRPPEYENTILYDLKNPQDYKQAIVDYISAMTDKYAIKTFEAVCFQER